MTKKLLLERLRKLEEERVSDPEVLLQREETAKEEKRLADEELNQRYAVWVRSTMSLMNCNLRIKIKLKYPVNFVIPLSRKTFEMFVLLIGSLIDCSIDWLFGRSIDWLIELEWSIDFLTILTSHFMLPDSSPTGSESGKFETCRRSSNLHPRGLWKFLEAGTCSTFVSKIGWGMEL